MRRRRQPDGSAGLMWVGVAGGGVLLVALLCGGGLGAYFMLGSPNPPAANEQVVEIAQPAPPPMFQPPPFQPPPFQPPPFQPPPFPPPPENLDPGDPKQIDRVLSLLAAP